ncbi:hypothetical protein Q5752_002633 [Cryptotrichosporon argae]
MRPPTAKRYFFASARLVGLPVVEPGYAPKTYSQAVLAALYTDLDPYPDDAADEFGSVGGASSPAASPVPPTPRVTRRSLASESKADTAGLLEQKRASLAKARAAKAAKSKERAELAAAATAAGPIRRAADDSRLRKRARVDYAERDVREPAASAVFATAQSVGRKTSGSNSKNKGKDRRPSDASATTRLRLKDMVHDADPDVARRAQEHLEAKRRSVANARLAKAAKAARAREEAQAAGLPTPESKRGTSDDTQSATESEGMADTDADDEDVSDDEGSDGSVEEDVPREE